MVRCCCPRPPREPECYPWFDPRSEPAYRRLGIDRFVAFIEQLRDDHSTGLSADVADPKVGTRCPEEVAVDGDHQLTDSVSIAQPSTNPCTCACAVDPLEQRICRQPRDVEAGLRETQREARDSVVDGHLDVEIQVRIQGQEDHRLSIDVTHH